MTRAASLAVGLTAALALALAAPARPDTAQRGAGRVVTGGRAIEPGAEPVELVADDGVKVHGAFYPSRDDGRSPAVVMIHDAGEDRSQFGDLPRDLARRGFAVLTIDLRGHGRSATAETNWRDMLEEDRERLWAFALRDVVAATQYLRGRRDVHASNLSLVGVGTGCTLSVRHAVGDENARAVVLIAPVGDHGFDLASDMYDLGGLPALILETKDNRKRGESLREASMDGQRGAELAVLKSSPEEILSDSRLTRDVQKFLRDKVMPQKGR